MTKKCKNCENKNKVSSDGDYSGGIVGIQVGDKYSSCTIINCVNSETVNGKDYVGGMIGYGKRVIEVAACNNAANISGGKFVGGYVGKTENATVKQATNNNVITGKGYVGGIAGYTNRVEQCINNGEVKSTENILIDSIKYIILGGIAGFARDADSCTNNADIEVNIEGLGVGGIIGCAEFLNDGTTTISNNVNNGFVFAFDKVGGIIGALDIFNDAIVNIMECENTKAIVSNGDFAGGIIGSQDGSSSTKKKCTISNCKNSGNVASHCYAGGIIGYGLSVNSDQNIWSSNTNTGTITGKMEYEGELYGYLK